MSKYKNLMEEVEIIRENCADYKCGILEALMFISENEEEFSSEVRRELKMFMREGAKMFAPVEEVEYELVSSDGTVIDTYTVRF